MMPYIIYESWFDGDVEIVISMERDEVRGEEMTSEMRREAKRREEMMMYYDHCS